VAKYGSAGGSGRYEAIEPRQLAGSIRIIALLAVGGSGVSHVANAEAVVKFLALDTRAQGQLADLWRNIPTRFAALGPSEGRDQDRLQPLLCVTSRVLSE
jgi:hypothetical protein